MVLRMIVQMAAMPATQEAITMMTMSVAWPMPEDDFLDVAADADADDAELDTEEDEPDANCVEVCVTALA